jgi:alanine racemase
LSGQPTGAHLGLAQDAPATSGLVVRAVDIRTSIRPSVAEVDLAALRRNLARIRATVGPGVAIYGVVKADAYGHGAVEVGRAIASSCEALAVSLVEEGLELRSAGLTCPIIVLGAYYGGRHSEVLEAGLTPVVYDLADLERFALAPTRRLPRGASTGDGAGLPDRAAEGRLDLHVKIETGMNRLGVQASELPGLLAAAARFPRLRVHGLCTHFSSADVADEGATREQLRRFDQALAAAASAGVTPSVIHAANSAATLRFADARFTAVRPGLALYGALPSDAIARDDLEPVLSLRTKIMALHDLAPGEGVSYGLRWRAERPSRVATLPIGYADGYPRHVRGAEVIVGGQRVPVAGAVCMDMMMVDVTDVPGAQVGDRVTLIGRDGAESISADDLGRWAGTVNYEIFCGLSKRVPRVYRDDAVAKSGRP